MITSTYINGNSILHKADPRIKTIILLTVVILLFFPHSITAMTIIIVMIFLIGSHSLGFFKLIHPLKMILQITIAGVIVLLAIITKDKSKCLFNTLCC